VRAVEVVGDVVLSDVQCRHEPGDFGDDVARPVTGLAERGGVELEAHASSLEAGHPRPLSATVLPACPPSEGASVNSE